MKDKGVIKTVYHSVDSNLEVEIFSKKERLTEKEEGSFGSCSTWEGENDLSWERKGLRRGPGVVGNYTN